ncbi:MAG TPA: PEP-utilizing enzyme, partial [archaeon]|nr:PEP-utilizing enzyme [archaeon]
IASPPSSDQPTGAQQASGIPASPGTARGLLAPVSGDLASSQGKVLLAPRPDRELLALLPSAAGAILGSGGALSAAAVLCREFQIPCVAGVAGLEALSGEAVLDGTAGAVLAPPAAPLAPALAQALPDDAIDAELLAMIADAEDLLKRAAALRAALLQRK